MYRPSAWTIAALAMMLFLMAPAPASAQIFRKLFGLEQERPQRRRPSQHRSKYSHQADEDEARNKPDKPQRPKTQMKSRYRIDVLAPLYLDELVRNGQPVYKAHLPDKVMPGLSFYHGIQLAADTLNGLGYHLDIYIHDLRDTQQSLSQLINRGGLDSADLIIGAVNASEVNPIATRAEAKHINFVSTIAPYDGGMKHNLYFSMLQPTLKAHCEAVAQTLARVSNSTTNLLVYQRSNVAVDRECYQYLTQEKSFAFTRVKVDSLLPDENLRHLLDSNATNIIAMPIVDAQYARKLLDQLGKSFPDFHFEVYGMPSWKGMKLFDEQGALPNVAVTFPTAFYYDPTGLAGKAFSDACEAKYGCKPGLMAYRGYETLLWYAYLLKQYGTFFNGHYADVGLSPFTRFNMKLLKVGNTSQYYENQHFYLYRYQAGNLMVQQ